jgi:hypothetical protein
MNDCVKVRTRSLGMLRVCLGLLLHAPRGPFIAPRQLGAVGGNLGRLILPSVGWRTGQSGVPLDSHCRRSGANLFPFLVQMTVADSWQMAHRTLSGAHRTVRCPVPTVGGGHASPTDCAVDRWLTGQSSAPPDSPVNYSRTSLILFLRATTSPRTTHRTVR